MKSARHQSRPGMQITDDQFFAFLKLFGVAWAQHCRDNALRASDSKAKETWRHDQIFEGCGLYSIKQVPKAGAPFVDLMAHLETVARNGVYWQLRKAGAGTRPLSWLIRELCEEHEIDEHYADGVARKALGLSEEQSLPLVDKMTPAQAGAFLHALKASISRLVPANDEERNPF